MVGQYDRRTSSITPKDLSFRNKGPFVGPKSCHGLWITRKLFVCDFFPPSGSRPNERRYVARFSNYTHHNDRGKMSTPSTLGVANFVDRFQCGVPWVGSRLRWWAREPGVRCAGGCYTQGSRGSCRVERVWEGPGLVGPWRSATSRPWCGVAAGSLGVGRIVVG